MFTANIYTPLDRGMVLLQLCCWKFSHSRLYSIKLDLRWLEFVNRHVFMKLLQRNTVNNVAKSYFSE